MPEWHFKVKFDQHFVQRVVWSRLSSDPEGFEAFLTKLGKKSAAGFEKFADVSNVLKHHARNH